MIPFIMWSFIGHNILAHSQRLALANLDTMREALVEFGAEIAAVE